MKTKLLAALGAVAIGAGLLLSPVVASATGASCDKAGIKTATKQVRQDQKALAAKSHQARADKASLKKDVSAKAGKSVVANDTKKVKSDTRSVKRARGRLAHDRRALSAKAAKCRGKTPASVK